MLEDVKGKCFSSRSTGKIDENRVTRLEFSKIKGLKELPSTRLVSVVFPSTVESLPDDVSAYATALCKLYGSPEAIRLIDEEKNAVTFDRSSALTVKDGNNEIWRIKLAVTSEKAAYSIFIKYNEDYIEPDGNTRTFSKYSTPSTEDGNELVWTIPLKFNLGKMNLGIRTRAAHTTFALTGDYVTGRVMY